MATAYQPIMEGASQVEESEKSLEKGQQKLMTVTGQVFCQPVTADNGQPNNEPKVTGQVFCQPVTADNGQPNNEPEVTGQIFCQPVTADNGRPNNEPKVTGQVFCQPVTADNGQPNNEPEADQSSLGVDFRSETDSNCLEEVVNQFPRYQREFVEIEKIGEGGFGSVFKSRHKLDTQEYAVKKVKSELKELNKVLREVEALAKLKHIHIVCYNTSWLENEQDSNISRTVKTSTSSQRTSEDDDIIFDEDFPIMPVHEADTNQNSSSGASSDSFIHGTVKTSSSSQRTSEDDGIIFDKDFPIMAVHEADTNQNSSSGASSDSFIHGAQRTSNRQRTYGDNNILPTAGPIRQAQTSGTRENSNESSSSSNEAERKPWTLYIQMELCGISLKKWIEVRNYVGQDENMTIFRQILKGVEYLHSKGILHRDINPRNIFLIGNDNNVKIGDFGFATNHFVSSPNDIGMRSSAVAHTAGLGTPVYSAPEQLNGKTYDMKCDIYSLGVILLEMFHLYETEMERSLSLGDLRKGIISPKIKQDWPVQVNYVIKMTSEDPTCRPTATELLSSEMFHSEDQRIKDLRGKETRSQEEIEELQQRVTMLLKEIEELQQSGSLQLKEIEELRQRETMLLKEIEELQRSGSLQPKEIKQLRQRETMLLEDFEELRQRESSQLKKIEEVRQRETMQLKEIEELRQRETMRLKEIEELRQRETMRLKEIEGLRQRETMQLKEIEELRQRETMRLIEIEGLRQRETMRLIEKYGAVNK